MRKGNHNSKLFKGLRGPNSSAALRLAPDGGAPAPHERLSEFDGRKVVLFPPQPSGNAARSYLDNLSPSGERSARARLQKFAEHHGHTLDSFPWAKMTPGHVLSFRGLMREEGARAVSINMALSHLKSVARTQRRLWPDGEMTAETCAAICEIESVRGSTPPAGRALTRAEIDLLFEACASGHTATGERDRALLSILYYVGLRRDEACTLRPEDWRERDHRLRVMGKGEKEEYVYVESKAARSALKRWVKRRGHVDGPLFCSVWRGGRVRLDEETGRARPLSGDAVYKIVERRAHAVGIEPCSPHDLRRSAITHLLEEGTDALAVQSFARHEQLSTTTRYDRRREHAKRAAARRLEPSPTRPRSRRKPHRPKTGRPRTAAPLSTRPKAQLLALARVHKADVVDSMTKDEIVAAILEVLT